MADYISVVMHGQRYIATLHCNVTLGGVVLHRSQMADYIASSSVVMHGQRYIGNVTLQQLVGQVRGVKLVGEVRGVGHRSEVHQSAVGAGPRSEPKP